MRAEGFKAGLKELGATLAAEIIVPDLFRNAEVIERALSAHVGEFDHHLALRTV